MPKQQTSKSSRLSRKKKRTTNLLINQNYIQQNKNSKPLSIIALNANGLNPPIKRHRLTGLESKIHLSVVFKEHHQQRYLWIKSWNSQKKMNGIGNHCVEWSNPGSERWTMPLASHIRILTSNFYICGCECEYKS